jgi:hypothetical protein
MIASAGEALEIEELRWHWRFCLAVLITVEQQRKIGHFSPFREGLRHNHVTNQRLYRNAVYF